MIPEIAVGAVIGLLVGTTGLGGPVLFVPALVLLMGYSLTEAVPISLAFIAVTQGVSLFGHYARRHVNMGVAKYFILGSIPSSIAVSQLMNLLARNPRTLERLDLSLTILVGLLLVLFSAITLFDALFAYRRGQKELVLTGNQRLTAAGLGLLAGALVASTSVGAASIVALSLAVGLRMRSIEVVGTGLIVTATMSALSAVVYLAHGAVPLLTVGMFLAGAVPCALLGTRLSDRVAGRPLRIIISLIVFTGGMSLLWSAV